jgi:DNA repair exonuclease SbcCD nuclease subunit
MALKILHTADWHLGLRHRTFDKEDERKLTRARLDVVDRILDCAERWGVQAMLCAGDLFDDAHPEKEWWQGLADRLQARDWSERPVFLLPGNHDPLIPGSVYAKDHPFRRALPDWAHVVDREGYVYELSPKAVLYASCCRSKAGQKDLALELPQRENGDERFRIGMVHGQTFTFPGLQTNFPVSLEAAESRGLDYLAIGDTHGFEDTTEDGPAPTLYPGAPEQTKFSEKDAGYVAVVYFRRRGRRPHIQRERVGRWLWREETVQELEDLRRLKNEDLGHTVLRLTVEMGVTLAGYDEVHRILDQLGGTDATHGRAGILQEDLTKLRIEGVAADDFPENLAAVLRATVDRLTAIEANSAVDTRQKDEARRALFHLYKLVTGAVG